MACEPETISKNRGELAPAVFISWGTRDEAIDPAETFPAGSGYFVSTSVVVTARHVPDLVRRDYGARNNQGVMRHRLTVHDPRSGLSWRVIRERSLEAADITLLGVVPLFTDICTEELFATRDVLFQAPSHRMSQVGVDERLSIRGFTNIGGELLRDNREQGGRREIIVHADGQLGNGVVAELCPYGYANVRHSCLRVEEVRILGNTSGAPVLDEAGRIIGIASASPDDAEACYSIVTDWHAILNETLPAGSVGNLQFNLQLQDRETWAVVFRIDDRAL